MKSFRFQIEKSKAQRFSIEAETILRRIEQQINTGVEHFKQ